MEKPTIIMHICCAICGVYLCEVLKEKYNIILFFYNPNIHPQDEYEKRRDSAKKLAEIYNVEFIEGKYEPEKWLSEITGLEKEPEGGKRCPVCFRMRLFQTALIAQNNNAKYFLTTLASSPFKDENIVNQIGEDLAKKFNLNFLKLTELKENKKQIWQKTRALAKQYNFYRQKYCGCVFSSYK